MMDSARAIPEDELLLARLASAKLAKMLQGIMSVGTAALELESPADFLTGKDRALLAFIQVLECIGVKPGFGEIVQTLRLDATKLSLLALRFHQHFLDVARWRTLSAPDLCAAADRLLASYAELCQALDAFREHLGVECDCSPQVQQARQALSATLNLCAPLPT
jgi:hypothetical protein